MQQYTTPDRTGNKIMNKKKSISIGGKSGFNQKK